MNAEFFTIAICTYNRAGVLPYALKAALAQTLSASHYEILIIDNNSTDETPKIVEDSTRSHAHIRALRESRQGLSFARNRAYEEARGDVIIYVDDDAEMAPQYLENLKRIWEEEKEIGALGGPIEVGWLGPVPSWYEPGMDRVFNYLYNGSYRMKIYYPMLIYGTNMAFPVTLLKKIGGFQTNLGRIGEHPLSGEDIEILLRLEKRENLPVLYDPALKVRHLISPERLSPEYILYKTFWIGRSQRLLERQYHIRGGLGNALWSLFESYIRQFFGRIPGRLTEKTIQAMSRGYLREWWAHPEIF